MSEDHRGIQIIYTGGKSMKCDICGKECNEILDLHINGDDDLYMFDVCKDCLNKYQSDTYTAKDVLEDIIINTNKRNIDLLKKDLIAYKESLNDSTITDKEIKAQYFLDKLCNIDTYDYDLDVDFYNILVNVMDAIVNHKNTEVIDISDDNYRLFILFANLIKDYIDWGTSIITCFFTKIRLNLDMISSYVIFNNDTEIKALVYYMSQNEI